MKKTKALVLENLALTEDIFSLTIRAELDTLPLPGQFVMLYPADQSHLLPRPISVAMAEEDRIRMIIRKVGKGTAEFSALSAGEELEVLGPLGNGFPVEDWNEKNVLLCGGGIGIPPLLYAGAALAHPRFALGYRDKAFLKEEAEAIGEVRTASESGEEGIRGYVTDLFPGFAGSIDVIFACGPMSMLRAVALYAEKEKIPCFVSLEERMACGVGACLGCVHKMKQENPHTHVRNARVCTEGPVFPAEEIEWT